MSADTRLLCWCWCCDAIVSPPTRSGTVAKMRFARRGETVVVTLFELQPFLPSIRSLSLLYTFSLLSKQILVSSRGVSCWGVVGFAVMIRLLFSVVMGACWCVRW